MSRNHNPDDDTDHGTNGDLAMTRRAAMALLGVGGVGAAMAGGGSAATETATDDGEGTSARPWNQDVDARGHDLQNLGALDAETASTGSLYTAARDADVLVWRDEEDVFHADSAEQSLYTGEDFTEAVQAGIDGLTDGRTTKEKVVVACSGTMGPHEWDGDVEAIDVPSYTIVDFRGTIYVKDEGEALVRPLRASDAVEIEVPRIEIVGNPRAGIWFQSVRNVRFGRVDVRMPEEDRIAGVGGGVRIDAFAHGRGEDAIRSADVQIESAYLENTGHHAIETYAVDRLQIGDVIAKDPAGSGVQLNQTVDATIDNVVCEDPGLPSHYPAFRLANHCENVTLGQLVSRGGARGIMLTSSIPAHRDVTIGEVTIEDAAMNGILIGQCQDVVVSGGVVRNCGGEPIRIHSQPYRATYPPAEGITIANVRVVDDRPEGEKEHEWAILETGPFSGSNKIVDNDVRGGGTEGLIDVSSASSVVTGNVGDGVASGTVTLESGADPAARVGDISGHKGVTLDLRAKPFQGPDAAFAWDHYFVWNPDAGSWDMVFEWTVDPGENVDLDYIVDRPQANIGRGLDTEKGKPEPLTEGTYRITAAHSGKAMEVADGSTKAGANVQQWTWNGEASQQWEVTDLGSGSYRLDAVHSGQVLQVAGASEDNGANVQQGEWADEPHQHWRIEGYANGLYRLQVLHSMQVANVAGADKNDGANVVQWPWGGGAGNSLWRFEEV